VGCDGPPGFKSQSRRFSLVFIRGFFEELFLSGKTAVEQKFNGYLDEMLEYAAQELVEDHIFTKGVRKREMDKIDGEMRQQCGVTLDYAEEMLKDDVNNQEKFEDFLNSNPFLRHFSGPEDIEKRLKGELLDHFQEVSEDLALMLESDSEDFPGMMRDAYKDREEAEAVLEKNFSYADTIKDYGSYLDTSIGPVTVVDFSEDIMPVIDEGRERLEETLSDDLDRIYNE
jgi:hypothetical protein